jgi:hypothetical protein
MDIRRMQVGDVASRFLVRRLRETKAQFNDDSDGRQRKPWEASDGPVRAHNPKVRRLLLGAAVNEVPSTLPLAAWSRKEDSKLLPDGHVDMGLHQGSRQESYG